MCHDTIFNLVTSNFNCAMGVKRYPWQIDIEIHSITELVVDIAMFDV